MNFNSTLELLESDKESRAYFDSLPACIQKRLLDKYTGARSSRELKAFADELMRE